MTGPDFYTLFFKNVQAAGVIVDGNKRSFRATGPDVRVALPSPTRVKIHFGVSALALAFPLLSAVEIVLRGRDRVLLFHDFALPAVFLGSLGVFFPMVGAGAVLAPIALLLFFLCAARRPRPWEQGFGGSLRSILWLAIPRIFTLAVCVSTWMWFCSGHTLLAAAVAIALIATAFYAPGIRRILLSEFGMYGLGVIGGVAIVAIAVVGMASAQWEASETIFPTAAYDTVAGEGSTMAIATRGNDGVVVMDGFARNVGAANGPQRVAYESVGRRFLFANYWNKDGHSITSAGTGADEVIDLPECLQAIDVASFGGMVYVVCELSQNFVAYRAADEKRLQVWPLGLLPYAVTTDSVRHRVYASQEFGPVTVFDGNGGFLRFRRTGLGAFGLAVDEKTGTVWVARFLTGEVVALSPDLSVLARVPVGWAPRDLAIDPERRLLLAGNYFEGTVDVIDLDRRKRVSKFRVGSWSVLPLLRGVSVTPGGDWLVSQRSGVHRFRPRPALTP